jgi:hypothetical protein
MTNSRSSQLALGVALAAGCLAFGAKLMLMHAYGSDVPNWDEWNAIGTELLVPHALGQLRVVDFFRPHNEHVLLFTRLINYSLAEANGQWDALLEMTVNAAIHAGICAALILFARRLVRGARFTAVSLVITILFVLAFDRENTLVGFQSQFYLLVWGALGMFLLCVPSEPLSPRWWAGWLVGAASLGTMSSGFMAAATVLLLLAARCAIDRRLPARFAVAAALLAALCVAGVLTISHVAGHDALRAHTPWNWLFGAASALSWPIPGWPVAFVVLQLPVVVLVVKRVRERRIAGDEAILIALAAWTWMNAAAIAYGRAGTEMTVSPRYTDVYAIALIANALALAVLSCRDFRARVWAPLAALWIALFSLGLWEQNHLAYANVLNDLPRVKAQERLHIRAFLATGDPGALLSAPPNEVPYPRADLLANMLATPAIRDMLPLGIRPAVALSPEPGSNGFEAASPTELPLESGERVWIARKGPARFVSQLIEGDLLPFMHVAVCGSPDLNASELHIESASDIEPDGSFQLQGDRWHVSDVPVPPDSSVRVVVDIPAGDHWFAFAEPVELGRGSWANRWLLRRSGTVAAASGILFGAALAALLALDIYRRESLPDP